MPRFTILGIAREGWPVIAAVAVVLALVSGGLWILAPWVGIVMTIAAAIVTLWAVWFFRDPERTTPREPGAIICGADGVISFIGPGTPPPESGVTGDDARGLTRVSVFMNIFNVHVNRAPLAGTVQRIAYTPGKFFNASLEKASEHNERLSMVLLSADGGRFVVVQIAGLIARRIVCRVKEGAALRAGERFGLIRFGSRVDHYLPSGITPVVTVGQRVVAGETILGRATVTSDHAERLLQGAGA
ncbi:MAG: phosphatidylserine decarboxylase [Phycisphaerae bacterium]|nr:phosphatidylserine decarboxylase [Phycisphaerae bacterium]